MKVTDFTEEQLFSIPVRAARLWIASLLLFTGLASLAADSPAGIELHFNKAVHLQAQMQISEALKTASNALAYAQSNDVRVVRVWILLGGLYWDQRDHINAKACYQTAISIGDTNRREDLILRPLSELAQVLREMGDYTRAIEQSQRALLIATNHWGPDRHETWAYWYTCGLVLMTAEENSRAESAFSNALIAVEKKTNDVNNLKVAKVLASFAEAHRKLQHYATATNLLLRALEIHERNARVSQIDYSGALNDLGICYLDLGLYRNAMQLIEQALVIQQRLQRGSPTVDGTLPLTMNNLAATYQTLGNYAEAEKMYLDTLQVFTNAHTGTIDLCRAFINIAEFYRETGQFSNAVHFFETAVQGLKSTATAPSSLLLISLDGLAETCCDMGDFKRAGALYQQIFAANKNAKNMVFTESACELKLANLYVLKGDYAAAETKFQHAKELAEPTAPTNNGGYCSALDAHANFFQKIGQYSRSLELHTRVLELQLKCWGPTNTHTANAYNNLATDYGSMHDFGNAQKMLRKAIEIEEASRGPGHPHLATLLINLALNIYEGGHPEIAQPFAEQALRIGEVAYGREHPLLWNYLNVLARIVQSNEDWQRAEQLYERSLTSLERSRNNHPGIASVCNNLSLLHVSRTNLALALKFAKRAEQSRVMTLATVLTFTAERERLAFLAMNDPFTAFAAIGDAFSLAECILRWKGIVLDSLLEDQLAALQSPRPEIQELRDEHRKAALDAGALRRRWEVRDVSKSDQGALKAQLEQAESKVERLEGALAVHRDGLGQTRRALAVGLGQVQDVLSTNTVLIELIRHRHYPTGKKGSANYGAVIIGRTGPPRWVPLGSAESIETKVTAYQHAIRDGSSSKQLTAVLLALHDQIWAPLVLTLPPGVTNIILSPDAGLNFVSFGTLLNRKTNFVAEHYSIRYMASGRDLLACSVLNTNLSRQLVVFSNPDFIAAVKSTGSVQGIPTLVAQSSKRSAVDNCTFPPLPAAVREGEALVATGNAFGMVPSLLLGGGATKSQLQTLVAPRILHLATHGFIWGRSIADSGILTSQTGKYSVAAADRFPDNESTRSSELVEANAMYQTGLALAGAQTTCEAWKRGENTDPGSDGILTADEASRLNLEGTWLVTLSACDTGIGKIRSGEGVFGLRRAFTRAGAQNLLMTLWRSKDEYSAEFMPRFYQRVLITNDPSTALAQVQGEELKRLRQKEGILAAVQRAGPFVLSFQGH